MFWMNHSATLWYCGFRLKGDFSTTAIMAEIFRENEWEMKETVSRFVRDCLCVQCVLPFLRFGLFYIVIPKIHSNYMFNGMVHPCNLILQKSLANLYFQS